MSVKRIGLLALILAFGGSIEVLHRVRGHLDFGPWGVRVIGGRFFGPHFAFEEKRDEATAAVLEIKNSFGAVRTTPSEDGAIHVTLRKVVFLPDEAKARTLAERIHLVAERDGETLRIRTNREDVASEDTQTGFETHLEVTLPKDARVVVRSEHGPVTVARARSADVEASFDSIEMEDVAEAVRIKSHHGQTTVRRAGASVEIEARHGGVHVEDVEGSLTVDAEHGDVEAHRVGPLTARLTHGDIEARTVRGELTVRGSHSGVDASQVAGRADIETSFDAISLDDVTGEARVRSEHGKVRLVSIKGPVSVENKFGSLELEDVQGPVEFALENGGANVKDARHGVSGRCIRGSVELDGFGGPVTLEVEGGGTRLHPAAALSDAIKVTSRRGGVELVVPPGSRFSLDARAVRGQVEADGIDGITVEHGRRGEPSTGRGNVGGGGETIAIETEGGSVRLETGSPAGD